MTQRKLDPSAAARADIERLVRHDRQLAKRVVHVLGLLASGKVTGKALAESAKYGDLSDHYKLYVGLAGRPTHRIVYRVTPATIRVEAVGSRDLGLVYLEVSQRLGRLPAESLPALNDARRSPKRKRRGLGL